MFRLPPEIVKLLEAAASHPEGEGALFEGHVESVAALYQVHPQTVEQLRACVGLPAGQAKAAQILASARQHPVAAAQQHHFEPHEADAAALIAKASALPNGLELLTQGPIETAAIQLGTHPFVVEEARLHLAAHPDVPPDCPPANR